MLRYFTFCWVTVVIGSCTAVQSIYMQRHRWNVNISAELMCRQSHRSQTVSVSICSSHMNLTDKLLFSLPSLDMRNIGEQARCQPANIHTNTCAVRSFQIVYINQVEPMGVFRPGCVGAVVIGFLTNERTFGVCMAFVYNFWSLRTVTFLTLSTQKKNTRVISFFEPVNRSKANKPKVWIRPMSENHEDRIYKGTSLSCAVDLLPTFFLMSTFMVFPFVSEGPEEHMKA